MIRMVCTDPILDFIENVKKTDTDKETALDQVRDLMVNHSSYFPVSPPKDEEKKIEIRCDEPCDFMQNGICFCNWVRIWEGECESFTPIEEVE